MNNREYTMFLIKVLLGGAIGTVVGLVIVHFILKG